MYMAPQAMPQFFTKKGLDEFKLKIQGRYSKQNLQNLDYIEGYEDFAPETKISEYGDNLKDGADGASQDIKEYSQYAKQIKETTNNIIKKVEKGEFGKLIDKSGPAMRAYMESVKNKANYYLNSDNVSEKDKAKLRKQLETLKKKDLSSQSPDQKSN